MTTTPPIPTRRWDLHAVDLDEQVTQLESWPALPESEIARLSGGR
jgi:hypothetical protein